MKLSIFATPLVLFMASNAHANDSLSSTVGDAIKLTSLLDSAATITEFAERTLLPDGSVVASIRQNNTVEMTNTYMDRSSLDVNSTALTNVHVGSHRGNNTFETNGLTMQGSVMEANKTEYRNSTIPDSGINNSVYLQNFYMNGSIASLNKTTIK